MKYKYLGEKMSELQGALLSHIASIFAGLTSCGKGTVICDTGTVG